MRILFEHVNSFYYEITSSKKIKKYDLSLKSIGKNYHMENCIVARVTYENSDDAKIIDDIVDIFREINKIIGCDNLVLFPYAHLSNNLLSLDKVVEINQNIAQILPEVFDNVHVVPIIYDKKYVCDVKGHSFNAIYREL